MFDDLFKDLDTEINTSDSESNSDYVSSQGDVFGSTESLGRFDSSPKPAPTRSVNNNENFDSVVEMIVPPTKPKKNESEKPMVVVIDDDFPTIDLMKIYLQREYDYKPFDNPREAIFFLNKCVPDLIFLDCYISIIKSKKVVEIIKSYPEFESVPLYLIAEPDEIGAMQARIENEGITGVEGIITRPVARGELQEVLDKVFHK